MANSYYTNTDSFTEGTTASGTEVDAKFNAVEAGFDAVEPKLDGAVKLTNADIVTDQEITGDATTRANKVVGFDDSGNLTLRTAAVSWRGDWATSTFYRVNDIMQDSNGILGQDNIYICISEHTSAVIGFGLAGQAANWDLLVNVESVTAAQTAAEAAQTAAESAQSYAEEWANKAEDSLVSAAAGGDTVDDYSAMHWAKKAEATMASFDAGDYVATAGDTMTGDLTTLGDVFMYGLLGIGTNTPQAVAHFKDNGSIQIRMETSASYGSMVYSDGAFVLYSDAGNTEADSYIGFNVDGSDWAKINSAGTFMIQTLNNYSDTYALVVGGKAHIVDDVVLGDSLTVNGATYLDDSGYLMWGSADRASIRGASGASSYLEFRTNGGTAGMQFNANDRLKIGPFSSITDVGDFNLQVLGNSYVQDNLLVGTSTDVGGNTVFQAEGNGYFSTTANYGPQIIARHKAGLGSGYFRFQTSGETEDTVPLDNASLGNIQFCAYDGTDYETSGAEIRASVEGTIVSNNVRANLSFYTRNSGGTQTERARVTADGSLLIGTTTDNGEPLQVNGNIRLAGFDAAISGATTVAELITALKTVIKG